MRYIDWVHVGPRGSGRTSALAAAARVIGAKLVGASHEHARLLEHCHATPCVSVDANMRGTRGPYIFDHYTVERIILDYESELERLRRELEVAQDRLAKIKALCR